MISEMKFFHSFIVLENSSNKGMRDNIGKLCPQQSELTTPLPRLGVRLNHQQMINIGNNNPLPKHIPTGKNTGRPEYGQLVSKSITKCMNLGHCKFLHLPIHKNTVYCNI